MCISYILYTDIEDTLNIDVMSDENKQGARRTTKSADQREAFATSPNEELHISDILSNIHSHQTYPPHSRNVGGTRRENPSRYFHASRSSPKIKPPLHPKDSSVNKRGYKKPQTEDDVENTNYSRSQISHQRSSSDQERLSDPGPSFLDPTEKTSIFKQNPVHLQTDPQLSSSESVASTYDEQTSPSYYSPEKISTSKEDVNIHSPVQPSRVSSSNPYQDLPPQPDILYSQSFPQDLTSSQEDSQTEMSMHGQFHPRRHHFPFHVASLPTFQPMNIHQFRDWLSYEKGQVDNEKKHLEAERKRVELERKSIVRVTIDQHYNCIPLYFQTQCEKVSERGIFQYYVNHPHHMPSKHRLVDNIFFLV